MDLKKFKISDFELLRKLGSGKFGTVFLSREKSSKLLVVLKVMKKKDLERIGADKLIAREINIHYFLDHPSIIKMYGFFHDERNIYLILEYASGGDLY